jgi:hypothetical protein
MENENEIPLGVGAVIVNGDTGEVFNTPITEKELAEIEELSNKTTDQN